MKSKLKRVRRERITPSGTRYQFCGSSDMSAEAIAALDAMADAARRLLPARKEPLTVDLSALPQVEQYLEIQHHLLHLVGRPVLDLRATRKVLTRAFAHQDIWHAGFNLLPSD